MKEGSDILDDGVIASNAFVTVRRRVGDGDERWEWRAECDVCSGSFIHSAWGVKEVTAATTS